jgi:hypothetical protein
MDITNGFIKRPFNSINKNKRIKDEFNFYPFGTYAIQLTTIAQTTKAYYSSDSKYIFVTFIKAIALSMVLCAISFDIF